MSVTSDEHSGAAIDAGDLGRRMRERRAHLGLSVDELARRAGMAPGYVEYLERRPGANPGLAALTRLAAALETTVAALRGGGVERPPGARQANRGHPVLETLDVHECLRLLQAGGVGRAVFDDVRGPVAIPLNFVLASGELLVRTAEGSLLDAVRSTGRLTFEADHLDEALGEGWSVLVTGRAGVEHVPATPGAGPDGSSPGPLPDPWAGDGRDELVRIVVDEISGRRIRHRA